MGDLLRSRYREALDDASRAMPHAVARAAAAGVVPDPAEVLVVDTACASSLHAVELGVQALVGGHCEIAFCGGVLVIDPTNSVLFSKLRGLSPNGRLRALDASADGTMFSEGASAVALKLLSRARADGDRVLGVLAGFGAATDGRGRSIFAPNPAGQRRAVERARAVNGLEPDAVDWIIAHGTGTPAGDLAELSVLDEVAPADGYLCTAGKAVTGHPGWSAGTVSLIHALLGLRHETVPAQPAFTALPEGVDGKRVLAATLPSETGLLPPLRFTPEP